MTITRSSRREKQRANTLHCAVQSIPSTINSLAWHPINGLTGLLNKLIATLNDVHLLHPHPPSSTRQAIQSFQSLHHSPHPQQPTLLQEPHRSRGDTLGDTKQSHMHEISTPPLEPSENIEATDRLDAPAQLKDQRSLPSRRSLLPGQLRGVPGARTNAFDAILFNSSSGTNGDKRRPWP
jgi:hypothetical protein